MFAIRKGYLEAVASFFLLLNTGPNLNSFWDGCLLIINNYGFTTNTLTD